MTEKKKDRLGFRGRFWAKMNEVSDEMKAKGRIQSGKDMIRASVESHAEDQNWLERRWVTLDQARRKINGDLERSDACFKGRHDHCHFDLSPCDCECHKI